MTVPEAANSASRPSALVAPRRREAAAGPARVVYGPTRRGRRAVRRWLATPVAHLRDVRGALLLKLVLAKRLGVDVRPLVEAQRAAFAPHLARLAPRPRDGDPVTLWRHHSAAAVRALLTDLG